MSLSIFLIVSKAIKQVPHLSRGPGDVWPFWVLGMLFGYVHSLFKIRAFFTAKNLEWSGRAGIEAVDSVEDPAIEELDAPLSILSTTVSEFI